jgi:hypothetical protein
VASWNSSPLGSFENQIDHMVDALEVRRLEPAAVGANLLEMLVGGQELPAEEEAIQGPDLVARGQQHGDQRGADVAPGARDENALHDCTCPLVIRDR